MPLDLCKHRNRDGYGHIELFGEKTEVAPAFSAAARQKERARGNSQLSPLERKQEERKKRQIRRRSSLLTVFIKLFSSWKMLSLVVR